MTRASSPHMGYHNNGHQPATSSTCITLFPHTPPLPECPFLSGRSVWLESKSWRLWEKTMGVRLSAQIMRKILFTDTGALTYESWRHAVFENWARLSLPDGHRINVCMHSVSRCVLLVLSVWFDANLYVQMWISFHISTCSNMQYVNQHQNVAVTSLGFM